MRISRLTVDKLGIKLYDKVSAVLAELVANAYDADATNVCVTAPMAEFLATKAANEVNDKGYEITVADNGHGMTPEEAEEHFLVVGAERRSDPRRGPLSRHFRRRVMGRKGVGKLAPFGICSQIEVTSAGGEKCAGYYPDGSQGEGYITAHFILDSDQILNDTDEDYEPATGAKDGFLSDEHGTKIALRNFSRRQVPAIDVLERQIARRFGIESPDWSVRLFDSQTTTDAYDHARIVGAFQASPNEETMLHLGTEGVFDAQGNPVDAIEAGFVHEGKYYPITGWVGYSKHPYKDDLMAGIRIYCNGKIAAQTTVFNMRAGFTGEHDIRSYLIGAINADWLDEDEDLIQTDRRDIQWSSDLGASFEEWGRRLVKYVGLHTRRSMQKESWEAFREASGLDERVRSAFPGEDKESLRTKALEIAKIFGEKLRRDEATRDEEIGELADLSIRFAPHIELNEELRRAAEESETTLATVSAILGRARVAELSSFGSIAENRVRVIERVENLKDEESTQERALQDLIKNAPWLIDPQWSPVTANRSFATLKRELEKYLTGRGMPTTLTIPEDSGKRMDFVLANFEGWLEIIEIKSPGKVFDDEDFARFIRYDELLEEFWGDDGNKDILGEFHRGFRFTIVADGIKVAHTNKRALESLEQSDKLTRITWRSFLQRAERAHQEFLDEADRQRRETPL